MLDDENVQSAQPEDAVQTETQSNAENSESTDEVNDQISVNSTDKESLNTESAPEKEKKQEKDWKLKRIDKLTWEKTNYIQENENLKQQTAHLLEELAARQNNNSSDEAKKPEDALKLTQAQIDRLAEQKAKEMTAADKFNEACQGVYQKALKEFPDFEQSVENIRSVGGLPYDLLNMITKIPDAHKIIHHLGKNPEEAADLLSKELTDQAMSLAKLEMRLSKQPDPKPISNAPAPLVTVEGRGRSAPSLENEELSTKEWMKLRNKQLSEKRG